VGRVPADLVVGVKKTLGKQASDVPAADSVDDPLAVALSFDESSESQLGQVLAAARLATSRSLSRSAHSMRTRVGSASSANEVTAALTWSVVSTSGCV
jgi:hypothetical protein